MLPFSQNWSFGLTGRNTKDPPDDWRQGSILAPHQRKPASWLRRIARITTSIRPSGRRIRGTVSLGLSALIADSLAGALLLTAKEQFPGIKLRIMVADCETIKQYLASGQLDLALVFEDRLSTRFRRRTLFRHRVFFVSADRSTDCPAEIPLRVAAAGPLLLPPAPSAMRNLLDHAFAQERIKVEIASEMDHQPTLLAAVREGLGSTIVPQTGEFRAAPFGDLPAPRPLDPPLVLTSSILWSNEEPMTGADHAICDLLAAQFVARIGEASGYGIERFAN